MHIIVAAGGVKYIIGMRDLHLFTMLANVKETSRNGVEIILA
jgi:hypothetical protein